MEDGYIGTIMLWAGSWVPQNWMFCQGQSLQVNQYSALYSIIGNIYGGNTTSFNLPDLRGCVPVGPGLAKSGTTYVLGQSGGTERTPLTLTQLPMHNHPLVGTASVSGNITATMKVNNTTQNGGSPSNQYLGIDSNGGGIYANNTDNTTLNTGAINVNSSGLTVNTSGLQTGIAGQSQPVSRMQPWLGLNYIICVMGQYPTKS